MSRHQIVFRSSWIGTGSWNEEMKERGAPSMVETPVRAGRKTSPAASDAGSGSRSGTGVKSSPPTLTQTGGQTIDMLFLTLTSCQLKHRLSWNRFSFLLYSLLLLSIMVSLAPKSHSRVTDFHFLKLTNCSQGAMCLQLDQRFQQIL